MNLLAISSHAMIFYQRTILEQESWHGMRTLFRLPCLLALSIGLLTAQPALANEAASWNRFALETFPGAKMQFLQMERDMAMVQIAVYEAANAIQPTYVRSVIAIPDAPGASLPAAIAEAACRTMIAVAPSLAGTAEAERNRKLASIPDSKARTEGIAAGAAAAAAVLKWRAGDGADWSTDYTPGTGPGVYQPTSDQPMVAPMAAKLRPFVIASSSAFRPPPPPALDSPQMRRDMEEVAAWGSSGSTLRTADETEFARFHGRPGFAAWNNVARQAVDHLHLGEVETAHLLAALESAIVDTDVAVWEAKYGYNLWRPITALRAGGGPLNLKPLPDWNPLIFTPMIPEYPCGHCGSAAAAATILEGLAGDGPIPFTLEERGFTRHYYSFRQYAEEESISRVYAGVHYRWSTYVGESMGREIGAAVLNRTAKTLSAGAATGSAADPAH